MSTPQLSRVRVQRIAEEAVERARLRVVPRTRVRAPKVPFVTLVSAILLAGVVGLLMFNTTMQQNSFTVADLQARAADLRSQEQTLRGELDELDDPQRIAEAASRLGMVEPACPRFLYTATNRVTPGCTEAAQPIDVSPAPAKRPESLVPERRVVRVQPTPPPADTPPVDPAAGATALSNGTPR
jgi:cell division protein FtsL